MPPLDSLIAAFTGSDVVSLVTGLVWPVLVGVVVVLLLPTIKRVLESRAFTVKVAGMEVSVQKASDSLNERLDDLRDHVLGIDSAITGQAAPITPAVNAGAGLQRILWVDDYPVNNAFEVDTLQRKGVIIDQVKSTAEALKEVDSGRPFDVVISDMGRDADGPDAGLALLAALRARSVTAPVIFYASAPAVARTKAQAMADGAYGITSSATELMSLLAALPTTA